MFGSYYFWWAVLIFPNLFISVREIRYKTVSHVKCHWYHGEPDMGRTSITEICAKPSPSWAAIGRHPKDISMLPMCHSLVCIVPNKAQPNIKQLEGLWFVLLWSHCSDCAILQPPRADCPHCWTGHRKPGAQQLQKLHWILTNLNVDLIPRVTSSVLHNDVVS